MCFLRFYGGIFGKRQQTIILSQMNIAELELDVYRTLLCPQVLQNSQDKIAVDFGVCPDFLQLCEMLVSFLFILCI